MSEMVTSGVLKMKLHLSSRLLTAMSIKVTPTTPQRDFGMMV
jgi:hypothetical protein